MKKGLIPILASLLVAGSMSAVVPETKEQKLSHAINDLAFDLLKSSGNDRNVFISPFSISTALALLYLGADGTTAEAMSRVLNYKTYGLTENDVHETFHSILSRLDLNDGQYQLSSYNGALVQNGFPILDSFKQSLSQKYNAAIENVDFATQGEQVKSKINADVDKATRGKIKDFLEQPPSSDTVLFLLNAVYFLGSWKNPFNVQSTYVSTFYNNGVQEKKVQMMSRDASYKFTKRNDLNASVVVLPYKGEESASMIIVLPNQRDGVDQLQKQINQSSLNSALSTARDGRLDLSVPKFSLAYKTDLVNSLSTLGLGELFGSSANLSRIAGNEAKLKVSKITHKAVIDVDEKGTEAAGATGIEIVPTSLPPSIRVDHPFLFFIRDDQSGMFLFSGKVDQL